MSEEIDKHVLKKYEVQQRLGKGVSAATRLTSSCRCRLKDASRG
jgi:predicted  nucleic acid-binding Zn-ribbon protein